MAVQSLALSWRDIAAEPKRGVFHPVSAWYRLNDLASLTAQIEVAEISAAGQVVPAVEIRSQPGAKVVTIGRSRSSAGAGGWQKRALVRILVFSGRALSERFFLPGRAPHRLKRRIETDL
jgi:hypothetical protein